VILVRRKRERSVVAYGLVTVLMSVLVTPSYAQPALGGTGGEQTELGCVSTLIYASRIHGDFVAGGRSTRAAIQSEPVPVQISGIPSGATVKKAFAIDPLRFIQQ